jgi:hypothetical protein
MRMLITIEMGSGLSIRELLATESNTTKVLKIIIRQLERESGKKLKGIHTDSNDVRLHEVVEDICKRNGIQYDLHPKSKRNSAAAHATAAYLQKAKTMLHTVGMDVPY